MTYPKPVDVAAAFHAAYEDLAPDFGYRTRLESRVSWADLPQSLRDLMVTTVRAVMIEKYDLLRPEKDRTRREGYDFGGPT